MGDGTQDSRPAPRLLALATAVPPHELTQAEVAAAAPRLFPDRGAELARLLPVYANAGIERRYSCLPLADYLTPSDWRKRNARYIEGALDLLEEATDQCLAEAGLGPEAVDALVTVSTTGLATPSLDARLMGRLAFRHDVERLPVFGLGCAGGVLGLGRAAALAAARPGARVLLLVVELCALTFRHGDRSNANIVASAIFGDGAAAALISTGEANHEDAPAIVHWGEHTWPDSLDVMGWSVENDGLGVVFSRDIPTIVRRDLGAALDGYLAKHGLERADIDHYVSHPGGAKVIRALEEVCGLQRGAMVEAREVLRRYGNMSAASVLFVLEAVRRGRPVSWLAVIVGLVATQRLGELAYARRNTARLLARGAREVGAGHYLPLIGLHVAWLAAMLLLVPAGAAPHWPLIGVYLILQAARVWVIWSLGPYWTTRLITLPGAPLIRRGPYRFCRHPNYLVVVLEIAVLPLAFGAWEIALVFSVLNAGLLAHRIRIENAALAERASAAPKSPSPDREDPRRPA